MELYCKDWTALNYQAFPSLDEIASSTCYFEIYSLASVSNGAALIMERMGSRQWKTRLLIIAVSVLLNFYFLK